MSSEDAKKKSMDLIVLKYLQERGYSKAIDALKSESDTAKETNEVSLSDLEDILRERQSGSQSTGSESLLALLAEDQYTHGKANDSKKLTNAYQALSTFIYSSLDIYKSFVERINSSIIPCFYSLLSAAAAEKFAHFVAKFFITRFKTQHTFYHFDEILILESITSPEVMKDNEFAQKLLSSKFVIKLSTASYDLMMKYLMDSNEMSLMSIMNQFINFKRFKGQPTHISSLVAVDSRLILEKKKVEQNKKKRKDMDTPKSVLGDLENLETDYDMTKRNETIKVHWEIESTQQMSGEKSDVTAKAAQASAKKKEKKTDTQSAIEQDLKELSKAAPPAPPSVAFYTFFNCKNDLNVVELAPNLSHQASSGPIIAAGFSDTIKCWNWKTAEKRTVQKPKSDHDDIEMTNGGIEERSVDMSSGYSTLIGHSGPVFSLSFNSDNKWLLSSSEDSTVRLWNVETGSNVVVYKGHQHSVWDVSFSQFDYLFASASHDRTARIWCTDRVSPIRILAGHLSDVESVEFHPNCNYVATGSSDKTVRLWDVQTGECVRMFIGHFASIYALAFSKDGRYLASAGEDRQVCVWDLSTGKSLYEFKGFHKDTIWSLDFSADSKYVVSGSQDSTVRVFDISKSSVTKKKTVPTTAGVAPTLDVQEDEMSWKQRCMNTFYTKQTPVYSVHCLENNVVMAAGAFSA